MCVSVCVCYTIYFGFVLIYSLNGLFTQITALSVLRGKPSMQNINTIPKASPVPIYLIGISDSMYSCKGWPLRKNPELSGQ